jgi:hypothetical protein
VPISIWQDCNHFPAYPRSHIRDCAAQTHRVVAIHVAFNQAPRILHRQRRERMHSLFKRLEPSFQLSVRLRIKRRSAYAGHSEDTDQLLEIPGDEMRPVVGNDPGFCLRAFLLGLTDERSPHFQLRQDSSGFHCDSCAREALIRRVAHGRWLAHIPDCKIAIDSTAIAAPPACLEPEDLAVAPSNDCGERSTVFCTKGTPIECGPRHRRANLAQIFRTPTRSDLSRVAVNPVHSIRWTWLCL